MISRPAREWILPAHGCCPESADTLTQRGITLSIVNAHGRSATCFGGTIRKLAA